jgi:hypothetical protein
MDAEYIQNLRYKLQKRFRRLHAARWEVYHIFLMHFWTFLHSHSGFVGIIDDLLIRVSEAESIAHKIADEGQALFGDSEVETAAIAVHIIRHCLTTDQQLPEVHIAHIYAHENQHEDNQRYFTELFVEPLYEYIDEQLDDVGAVLGLLRKFKQKVEWFQRRHLYKAWENDTARGEKFLGLQLYEYLHDQGLDFFIEPTSASGEADMVSAQEGANRLIADTKVFNPDRSKGVTYIAKGFNQLYSYCVDFNSPVGYLIIFKTTPDDLRLVLSEQSHGTPFAVLNNKTIFFVLIDIFPHDESASKRGRVHGYELTERNLFELLAEERSEAQ